MEEMHAEIISHFKNKDNPIILDVGCYLGEDSERFANYLPNSEIYAFEADPRNIEIIKRNTLPSNIKLIEGAISNYDGITDFYCSNDINMDKDWKLSGSINMPTGHLSEYNVRFSSKPIQIFCQKLDSWYRNSSIYGKDIELVWCDVNGAEKEFLEGSIQVLDKIHLLYIECFEKELYKGQIDCKWINDFLDNRGFSYILNHGHNNLYERK